MKKRHLKLSLLAALVGAALYTPANAAIVRGDVDYQYFRDLAENKGQFSAGASNITITDKSGNNIGTFLKVTPKKVEITYPDPEPYDFDFCWDNPFHARCSLDDPEPIVNTITLDPVSVPMIDFSPINRINGYATLVNPQYAISVNHNQGYRTVQFGDSSSEKPDDHHYDYQVVRRNNYQPDPAKLRQDPAGGEARERNDNGNKIIYDASGRPTNRWDYHAPRLSKLVTEVVPAKEIERAAGEDPYEYYENFGDGTIFPIFMRAGSGRQAIVNATTDTMATRTEPKGGPYLIGGTVLPVSSDMDNGLGKILVAYSDGTPNDVFKDHGYGPLTTLGLPGDSGSALFGYDLRRGEWVVLGVYSDYFTANPTNQPGGNVNKSYWNYHHPHYVRALAAENTAGSITTSNANLTWTPTANTSTITGNGTNLKVDLADTTLPTLKGHNGNAGDNPWNPQLHHGKTFHISGENNTLKLADDINQGAGAIHFHGNTTVIGNTASTTWLGAGLDIDKEKTVTWKVGNPQGDRLSKIGQGTLIINGEGENLGSISVGDGTVILDQQAGQNGKKSAFSAVGIVSGRPTVVLNSADQVDPNHIYFGYRGGRLDLNGNDLTFRRIQNSDEGAQVVNHNANKAANIRLTGITSPTLDQVKVTSISRPDQVSPNMATTDIFRFQRLPNQPENYIRLKKPLTVKQIQDIFNAREVFIDLDFDTGLVLENEYFEVLGHNETAAKQQVLAEKIKAVEGTVQGFNGWFGETDASKTNGKLNITIDTQDVAKGKLLITGGTNLNGTLSAEGTSEIILSGRPTPHAYNKQENKEVIVEGDWINRTFNATTFQATGEGKIEVSRNVTHVNADFNVADNATAQIGFTQGKSQSCIRSDYSGNANCQVQSLSQTDLTSWERTTVKGNATLTENATFNLGSKATMTGSVNADKTTLLHLDTGSILNLTGTSTTGKTTGDNGSTLNLSGTLTTLSTTVLDVLNVENGRINLNQEQATNRNSLTANSLTGNGLFKFTTDLAGTVSDIVTIKGKASGQFNAEISPTSVANSDNKIKLLETASEENFSFNLLNEVRSGDYLYTLIKEGNSYYLNPEKIEEEEPEITQKGESVTADPLPEFTGEIEETQKGESVTAEPLPEFTGEIEETQKGESVTADPLPEFTGEIEETQKGESVTAEPLPEFTGEIEETQKGESVTAEPLPEFTGEIEETQKGESVTAEPLPEFTGEIEETQKGESVTAEPLPEFTGEIEETQKGESVTAEPLPEFTGEIEETQKGESVTAEPLPEFTGEIEETQKGESVTAEPLPEFTGEIEAEQPAPVVEPEKPIIFASELTAQTNAMLSISETLDKQLRQDNTEKWRVWSNTTRHNLVHHSNGHQVAQHNNLTQLGIENTAENGVTVGAILSHSNAHNDFAHKITGKGKITQISLYLKKTWENAAFIAFDTSYAKAKNRLNAAGEQSKFDRDIVSVGATIGKQWQIGGFNLKPSAGVRYHHLTAANYRLFGQEVETRSVDLVTYQAGVSIGKSFNVNGLSITPEIGSYYVDASHHNLRTKVNNTVFNQQIGRYFKHEAGVTFGGDKFTVGTHFGVMKGKEMKKQNLASIKLSYNW